MAAPGQQGDHLPGDDGHDPLPNFVMAEAKAHDPNVLPHMYDQEMIEEMFPQINAPVQIANNSDWVPGGCFVLPVVTVLLKSQLRDST